MYNIIRLIFTFVVFFFVGICAYSIVRPLWAHDTTIEEKPLNCDEINLGTYDYTHVSTNRPTRNNNPGNIRKTGVTYYGETSNDPAFESFSAPEWGYAAMFDLLDRLYTGLTLSEAIHKWAPPVENDTQRYVNFVAGSTDLHEDKFIINVNDERIIGVVKYMSILEGMKGFSDDDVTMGYMIWEECYNAD
jgi:hypothetical protein